MTDDSKIPKQELLAKLLRMSTSPNDGEALTSIRKANALLKAAGWDWDKLLAGKIRVAADPFANLGTPHNPGNGTPPPPSPGSAKPYYHQPKPPPPPQPRAPQPPPPPPKPAAPLKPHEPYSHRSTNGQTNIYAGNCYVCGHHVGAKDAHLFVPKQFNARATGDKKIICDTCDHDRHAFIDRTPAPKKGPRPFTGSAPSANDL